MPVQPIKPWLSITDQIAKLRLRGMNVPDDASAAHWLSAVGYYRLSGYWYPFRELDTTGQSRRLSTFVEGTTFGEVVGLYEFDRHLKTQVQSGLERIEVALRSQIGHQLGAIDPMAHTDARHFGRPSITPLGIGPCNDAWTAPAGATSSSITTMPSTVGNCRSGC